MLDSSRAWRASRLLIVVLAGLTLAFSAVQSVREDVLPSWVPETLGGLTIRAGDASELPVTRDDAIAYARMRLFVVEEPVSEPRPDSFAVRVTGRVPPQQPVPLPATGQVVFATSIESLHGL